MSTSGNSELCRIEQRLGRVESCPRERCAFWIRDETGPQQGCMFGRLDLAGRDDLARWLHELRYALEAAAAA
jgi:hypothetical protein